MKKEYIRDFKGIWIPKEIWLSEDLTTQERLFLAEIDSLDNEKGCFASNRYFANFFRLSDARCSQIISSLEKKRYITSQLVYHEDSLAVKERVLKVGTKYPKGGTKFSKGGTKYPKGGYLENAQENNTYTNNTVYYNNILSSLAEIVDYLNSKTSANFSKKSKKTRSLVNARMNEGYTVDDFKKVIDTKTEEWLHNGEMRKFLRPETLFSNKFEGYLNQGRIKPPVARKTNKDRETIEYLKSIENIHLKEDSDV